MVSPELETRFDEATIQVDELFTELVQQSGQGLGEFLNVSYTHLIISFIPGIRTVPSEGGGVYYEVNEAASVFLGGAAQKLPEALDVLKSICASNVFEGAEMPQSLRMKAHMLILGKFPGAKRRGPPLSQDFTQKFLMRQIALDIRDFFELTLTRHDGPTTLSACDAVSMVANKHGVDVQYKALESWCTHAKFKGFRERADAIWHHIVDDYLVSVGALKNSPSGLSGPFTELGRMRKT